MIIKYHRRFLKNFKKRIVPYPAVEEKFGCRFELFSNDSGDSLLQDHRLTGSKAGFRAFSVTGDVRVVYKRVNQEIILYDIGTHNQVY